MFWILTNFKNQILKWNQHVSCEIISTIFHCHCHNYALRRNFKHFVYPLVKRDRLCVTSPGKFPYGNRSNFSVSVSAERAEQPEAGIRTMMKPRKERQGREKEREREREAVYRIVRGRARNASKWSKVSVVWDFNDREWKWRVASDENSTENSPRFPTVGAFECYWSPSLESRNLGGNAIDSLVE